LAVSSDAKDVGAGIDDDNDDNDAEDDDDDDDDDASRDKLGTAA